jgi:hypothetical protein
MALKIVWRNPVSLPVSESQIEQIVADEYGAVYAVRNEDATRVFELILFSAA